MLARARSKVIEMKVAHFKCILVDVLQKSQTTEIMAIFLAAMVTVWISIDEFQALAMRFAARVLFPGTG